jgi:putative methyltransferase (TIGR04325 family)
MGAKAFAKRWLSPLLLARLKPLLRTGIYFSGPYPTWETAKVRASGYDSAVILDRVKEATLKVTNGSASFERDSVLFDEAQHPFPVLAELLRAAIAGRQQLSVLDVGGSLGSSYFQCRDFLSVVPALTWNVVEQPHFVECGRHLFTSGPLRFFDTIGACMEQTAPHIALLSSVLQYLPEPYRVLDELAERGIPSIVIDRNPFSDHETDVIATQHVPASIYPASYPCWVFSRRHFLTRIHRSYELVTRFDSADGQAVVGGLDFHFGGVILRKL